MTYQVITNIKKGPLTGDRTLGLERRGAPFRKAQVFTDTFPDPKKAQSHGRRGIVFRKWDRTPRDVS